MKLFLILMSVASAQQFIVDGKPFDKNKARHCYELNESKPGIFYFLDTCNKTELGINGACFAYTSKCGSQPTSGGYCVKTCKELGI